jgi:Sulfotransferase domain
VAWYRSRFPLSIRVNWRSGQVMEASPSYLPTPEAIRKMKQVLPKARVIVLLRDPVSRAFSHYQHRKTRHLESRSFEECIDEEIRANEFPPQLGVATRPNAARMWGYVARGYYALQLELLLKVFPRNKVLILDCADLFKDTRATCERVFDFMGLDSFDVEPTKIYNRGYYREQIDPRVAEKLRVHYRPYDELLAHVIDEQFTWMKPTAANAAA